MSPLVRFRFLSLLGTISVILAFFSYIETNSAIEAITTTALLLLSFVFFNLAASQIDDGDEPRLH